MKLKDFFKAKLNKYKVSKIELWRIENNYIIKVNEHIYFYLENLNIKYMLYPLTVKEYNIKFKKQKLTQINNIEQLLTIKKFHKLAKLILSGKKPFKTYYFDPNYYFSGEKEIIKELKKDYNDYNIRKRILENNSIILKFNFNHHFFSKDKLLNEIKIIKEFPILQLFKFNLDIYFGSGTGHQSTLKYILSLSLKDSINISGINIKMIMKLLKIKFKYSINSKDKMKELIQKIVLFEKYYKKLEEIQKFSNLKCDLYNLIFTKYKTYINYQEKFYFTTIETFEEDLKLNVIN